MNQFGPPDHAGLVASKESDIAARMNALLADLDGRTEIDVVDDLAYPLPVAVSATCWVSRQRTNRSSRKSWTPWCGP